MNQRIKTRRQNEGMKDVKEHDKFIMRRNPRQDSVSTSQEPSTYCPQIHVIKSGTGN